MKAHRVRVEKTITCGVETGFKMRARSRKKWEITGNIFFALFKQQLPARARHCEAFLPMHGASFQ